MLVMDFLWNGVWMKLLEAYALEHGTLSSYDCVSCLRYLCTAASPMQKDGQK